MYQQHLKKEKPFHIKRERRMASADSGTIPRVLLMTIVGSFMRKPHIVASKSNASLNLYAGIIIKNFINSALF
jgi:predicted permease